SVVADFVYFSTVQTQHPRLYVSAWDEMNYPLVITTRRQLCLRKCVLELPKALCHIAAVGVDCHDQRGLSSCRTLAVHLNGVGIAFPDPLFAAPPSAWQILKMEV